MVLIKNKVMPNAIVKIVFWQNIPSIHQAPVISEIAKQWHGEVVLVVDKVVDAERMKQGWYQPDYAPAKLIISPSRNERLRVLNKQLSETVHIFSGFHATPETAWTFRQIIKLPALVGVYAEPGSDRGLLGWLRSMLYAYFALRYDRYIDFLLATGRTGQSWYKKRGFSSEKIVPFGYFVGPAENIIQRKPMSSPATDRIKLLFVGSLEPHKGIDLLLKALARQKRNDWCLTVIGDGPEADSYKRLSEQFEITDKIAWLGNLPNAEVRYKMTSSDYLILPSRYDGWGAVVNESIMVGTPVIVSSACGASDLINGDDVGFIFPACDVSALACILNKIIVFGKITPSLRESLVLWANESISPNVIARYLLSIILAVRADKKFPSAPWY